MKSRLHLYWHRKVVAASGVSTRRPGRQQQDARVYGDPCVLSWLRQTAANARVLSLAASSSCACLTSKFKNSSVQQRQHYPAITMDHNQHPKAGTKRRMARSRCDCDRGCASLRRHSTYLARCKYCSGNIIATLSCLVDHVVTIWNGQ